MPNIPSTINGVTVNFASAVKKNVVQGVLDALNHCIRPDVATGHNLDSIFVSSARRNGTGPSRHNSGKAVDISRINGVRMDPGFVNNAPVRAIVTAIQRRFESFPQKRENFGPALKLKEGQSFPIGDHEDHIHFSVD